LIIIPITTNNNIIVRKLKTDRFGGQTVAITFAAESFVSAVATVVEVVTTTTTTAGKNSARQFVPIDVAAEWRVCGHRMCRAKR